MGTSVVFKADVPQFVELLTWDIMVRISKLGHKLLQEINYIYCWRQTNCQKIKLGTMPRHMSLPQKYEQMLTTVPGRYTTRPNLFRNADKLTTWQTWLNSMNATMFPVIDGKYLMLNINLSYVSWSVSFWGHTQFCVFFFTDYTFFLQAANFLFYFEANHSDFS